MGKTRRRPQQRRNGFTWFALVLCCGAVSEFAKFFGLSFSALLPLINPVGDALVFLALVGTARPVVYRSLAKKIAISTTLFLVMIELLGTAMLNFFGISLPVMQVAGGLALAAMGWRMLNQEQPGTKDERTEVGDAVLGSLERKIFYPFTFPITAGPGCIVVMVTLSAHASAKGLLPNMAAHAGIVLAVVLLSVAVYFCYGYAPAITARVSSQTAHGIMRVISFVLLCVGAQITWNGLEALLKMVVKS
jgi:multiple antibiotic resistance protein